MTSVTTPPVHCVTASEAGLLSNSYVVEGRDRLVVIDPPMLLSDARALAQKVTAIGKPLGAIVVTHAHPDHANGAVALPDVPIVALAATAQVLSQTAESKRAQWTPVFGDDYPQSIRFPTQHVYDGEAYSLDELVFRVTDLGAGECASMALWILEQPGRAVFAGDFIYPGIHGWLAEGRTAAWLTQLERLATLVQNGDRLYPGHGDVTTVEALSQQATYLNAFREVVARYADGKAALDPAAVSSIVAEMTSRYPSYRLPGLIGLGAAGVAAELANLAQSGR